MLNFLWLVPLLCLSKGDQGDVEVRRDAADFDVDAYLEKYGYFAPRADDTGTQFAHSEHSRRHAIKLFQKFAHLPTTGQINKETVNKMRQPRCGFPDIIHTNDHNPEDPLKYTAGPKWKNKTVTWKITSYTDKLEINQQRTAIENSFRHWENASGLTFIEINDTANINIQFASGNHGDGIKNAFDGAGGVLAHAYLPEDGRAHFDNDEFWVFHESEGAEIEMVATHELGHSLGLSHSTVMGALMAPFYQQYNENFTLNWDDVAGIQYLYGTPEVPSSEKEEENTTSSIDATTGARAPNTKIGNETNVSQVTVKPDSTATNTTTKADTVTKVAAEPVSTVKPRVRDEKLCTSKIDAAIPGESGELLIFIGPLVYKLYEDCEGKFTCVVDGYPKKIKKVFKKGPRRVKTAAYLPDKRKRTYLFKGRKVWRYTGKRLDKGYPKQMSKQDIPYKPNAAYIQKNQFADYQWYIFGGKYFWEMNLYSDGITNGVMKTKTYWPHVPSKPDAMLQTREGSIYIFKGKYYDRYDHRRVILDKKKLIARDLLGADCSE
ncbi:matrix metalloproteinase-19-like isoform X1 [Ruditapes philippinarum]|uniref:matrix metalloproteinase-19-like isoform X1 n=1 Tax=Ruditapes philippinarum TaxID=129788 RepID=UPI00295B742B|nr:matrix metalloproteinase-19-like isoform X1 [Ruditapes philippinarum]